MEYYSRVLQISKSRFPPDLRDALPATSPLVFEYHSKVAGTGTRGSLIEIRVRTKQAGRIVEPAGKAKG